MAARRFAKLAQQLSMRADMLPYAYCAELSKMLDQADPFPTSEAIAIIERSPGGPLDEVFSAFRSGPDRFGLARRASIRRNCEPASASPSRCAGRASVRWSPPTCARWTGFWCWRNADHHPAGWNPVIPAGIRGDPLQRNEFPPGGALHALFRQRAAKRRKGVTAPRVYFEYCTEEVMVSELVTGVWMWELMAAVDSNDQPFLAKVAEIGIEPRSLARKLVRVMQHEIQEELFFHARPASGQPRRDGQQ